MAQRMHVIRAWFLHALPIALLARPGDFFLAFLCGLSGIPYILGVSRPESLASLLPEAFIRGWGAALTIGAAALICGLSSITYTATGREMIRRPACYKLGLRLFVASGSAYGAVILIVAGLQAVAASAAVFMFVGFCGIRLLTIGVSEDLWEEKTEQSGDDRGDR